VVYKKKQNRAHEEQETEFKDQVISIRRTTKVVKGGKNLSFSALVAVGNENGTVGVGSGKAREVPIPHFIKGVHCGGAVILRPASEGTGVIAGGAVRVIMELSGIKDILTKSLRSNNKISVAHATINALKNLKSPADLSKIRDKDEEMIWQ